MPARPAKPAAIAETARPAAEADSAAPAQRLDLYLWCARIAASRTACAALAETGMVRINRQPVAKAHAKVRIGDVLTIPQGRQIRILRVRAFAPRRGSAKDAAMLYEDLTPQAGPG